MKLLSGALLPVGVAVVFWKEAAAQVFSKYTDSNGIDFWQGMSILYKINCHRQVS